MGPGYTQTYNGGFMGGMGGINNYGPSYSQTYGKRSIGKIFIHFLSSSFKYIILILIILILK